MQKKITIIVAFFEEMIYNNFISGEKWCKVVLSGTVLVVLNLEGRLC